MFDRHYRLYSNSLFVVDAVSGFPALYLSYFLRSYLVRFFPPELSRYFNPELLPFRDYLFYFLAFLPLWASLLRITQCYSQVLRLSARQQAVRVLSFMLATGFLMGFLSYSFRLEVSRPVLFVFLGSTAVILFLNRIVFHWVLRSRNINEHNQIKILIVGTDARARRVGQWLENFKIWGYDVVGYLAHGEGDATTAEMNVLGLLRELPVLLQERTVVDEIIFVGPQKQDPEYFEKTIRLCEHLGIRTRVATDFFPTSISKVSLEFLENLPLITFSTAPDHNIAIVAKRALDFIMAVLLLTLALPLMLLVAMLIEGTSQGPVFYKQVRCGLYGRKFALMKFRTMIEGAEDRLWEIKHLNEMGGPVFKMRNDPRVTPLGRVLRKLSIDELPQLWNVIKGEMSMVGPRAPLPEEVRYYSLKQRRRLSVKPGITCLWQVSGRSDVNFHQWMALDLQYIDNWSFWLDMQIMLKTIPVVLTGRGAR